MQPFVLASAARPRPYAALGRVCLWIPVAAAGFAQETPSAPLPADVRAELTGVVDFSFSYDGPALDALLRFLRGGAPEAVDPLVVERWSDLLERPRDFRGVPVTVHGVVVRCSAWRFQQPDRAQLGTIHELQLRREDQPIICKLVCTSDVSDLAIGSTVTATGYFLTIQQYYSETNRLHQAAVLVGVGPTRIESPAPRPSAVPEASWIVGILCALLGGLVVAWLLLRRAAARPEPPQRVLRAERPAPMNLSQDLADWARTQEPPPK